MPKFSRISVLLVLVLAGVLWGCGDSTSSPTNANMASPQVVSNTATPTLTPIPPTPTPTPEPLAATVNGEKITLAEYQAELERFKASNPEFSNDVEALVINDLIDQVLLAQGAREKGFVVDEAMVEERIKELIDETGGEQAFSKWLEVNHYTLDGFSRALQRTMASAWMRDYIIASVPMEMEQVHALQILLRTKDEAIEVLAQLESGKDFATLALTYDPVSLGDLGWFPRGYLTDIKLEEAAFSLQPDEVSDIIETPLGYHILKVIERDPRRPLEPDAHMVLQRKALFNWLEQKRAQSEIVILLP